MNMKGILYGVGVGPGDPELMTLKAVRLIKENEIIAVPGTDPKESTAYRIAAGAVPEIADKTLVAVDIPMVKDKKRIIEAHTAGAERVAAYLEQGRNVVFLNLGDITVYSSYMYIQNRVREMGYQAEVVSGITSFCAAAARLGVSLCEWSEPLHIIPALHRTKEALDLPGNYVLMKSGTKMNEIKKLLADSGRDVMMVENCSMPDEKVYRGVDEIPDDAGYFSLIIAKQKQKSLE